MNLSRIFSMFLIITGGFIAIYAQARDDQNQYILIAGIVVLMLGVYRVSRHIPSKKDTKDEDNQNDD